MIQQEANLEKLIPSNPDDSEETDEGIVDALMQNAINGISTDAFKMNINDKDITLSYSDPDIQLTDISGTGMMVQLMNIVNDNAVNSVTVENGENSTIIDSSDTTSSAKSKLLPIVAAAAGDGTLGGLNAEVFTIKVNTNSGDIVYELTAAESI